MGNSIGKGDKRRLYNMQSRSDKIVQSVSDDYEAEDLLLTGGRSSGGVNYLKVFVLSLGVLVIFVSGFVSHMLVNGFETPTAEHKIDNVGSVIKPSKIKEYLTELSKETHLAGSERNFELAQFIANKFHEFAFDDIEYKNYSIRLPYPDDDKPNSVKLLDSSGTIQHTCRNKEIPLTDFEKQNPTTPLFNAHSKQGTVQRPYIYVNYASEDDFKLLSDNNISVVDKVVLARYGHMYRGNKVLNAANAGAAAIVLFKDLTGPGIIERYPESEWAPSSAGERGSAYVGDGDTDSLGWPSVEDSFLKPDGPPALTKIISQPITGDDAVVLLKALPQPPGFTPPDQWKVGLFEDEFYVGTGAVNGPYLQVTVNAKIRRVNITNVIGTITGAVEPDRWVILGNHRDAWTYGAMDPGSGTAAMIEVGRALSHFLSKGWRPRRTIKFCSWDAEEWGLIGSIEWVEEYRSLLRSRGVIYVNTDIAEGGTCNKVFAMGSPLFETMTKSALDNVNDGKTAYFTLSGSGSDHYGFYCYAGMSVLDVRCSDSADLYHTLYDTIRQFEVSDKDYKNLAKVATVLAQVVVGVSQPALVPGNVQDYTDKIKGWWDGIRLQMIQVLDRLGVDEGAVHIIDKTLVKLDKAAKKFQSDVYSKISDTSSVLELRKVNDILMEFERAFLVDKDIPEADFYSKNILVSPSQSDIYSGSGFPSLQHVISTTDISNKTVLYEIERVRWALQAAVQVLSLP